MAIIQQPDSLSLSGNIKKFIISSGSLVSFKLSEGGSTLIDEIYDPGAQGRVEIDIRQVVEGRLSFSLAGSNFYTQSGIAKSFTAMVDGSSVSFKVIRAGVDNIADTPSNWLTNNFLTWQPTTKAVSYHSPEWITYYAVQASTLKLRATFDDNSTHTISLGSMSAGSAYTANVQYALVAGLLGQRYPIYFDVWAESSGGARLTYSQRYYYSLPLADIEQWYLFENSLGGIDTLRTSGATLFEGSHAHELSVIDGVATEFNIDTERIYTQHTGALDTYQRRWLADLYPSRRKYLHHQGSFRPIVFTDGVAQYSTGDLPSNFSFSFRFANDSRGLLNLIRNEASIPTNITLPNLSAPNFILPPRLSEYPRISLSEGVILPAFDPHSETPKITTVGALVAAAVAEALGAIPGGDGSPGGGGQLVNIIKEHSLSAGTDNDVFSSNRTRKEINDAIQAFADSIDDYLSNLDDTYLSRINDDTAQGLITFLKGIIASDLSTFTDLIASGKIIAENIDVKNHLLTNTLKVILQADLQTILLRGQMNSEAFASGFLGHGMRLRKDGEDWELELDKLTVRKAMTVYELIVQEIRYQGGQHIFGPAGAKLTKVTDNGSHWRCEHDGTMDFITGAQVLCQRFKVGSKAENPDGSTTFKDARIKRYWRLVTSYGSGWFNLSKIDCESGSDFPEIDDQVAVLGHRINPDWQNAIMLVSTGSDAPYMAYYAGINSYSTEGKEVIREGNLNGIVDAQFGQLRGHGLYAENVYLKGQFRLNNNKLIEDAINDAHDKQTIGAYNLLREYDARFNFKYWGEDGEKVEVDFNEINPHTVMILCDRDNVIVTEDNLAIKIIL